MKNDHECELLNGYDNLNSIIFLSKSSRCIVKEKSNFRLHARMYSFSQRTINVCNKLSTDCVHGSSVNMSKREYTNIL